MMLLVKEIKRQRTKPWKMIFIKLFLVKAASKDFYDKQLQTEILNTAQYKGFEIFMLNSHGTGAESLSKSNNRILGFWTK